MRLGLFPRLALSVFIGALVASCFTVGLALYLGLERVSSLWQPRAATTSQIITNTVSAVVLAGQKDKVPEVIKPYLKLAGVQSIHIHYEDSSHPLQINVEPEKTAPNWFSSVIGLPDQSIDTVIKNDNGIPLATLSLHLSQQPYVNGLWEMLLRVTTVLAGGSLILLVIAIGLMRGNLKPLAALTAATKAVGGGDFSIRLKTKGVSSDVVPAVNAFNDMARKIEDLVKKLNERQSFLSTIFTSTPVGIIQIDTEGNPLFANNAARQFAGIDSENFENINLFERIHPDDKSKALDHWHYVQSSGCPDTVSFRYASKNNHNIWVTCNTTCMRGVDNNIDSFITFITDISKEVALHERTQQVSSFYLTLSQLNASIIHTNSREELFHVICDICMNQGGFAQALVVTLDQYIEDDVIRAKVVSLTPGNNVLQEMTDIELSHKKGAKSLIGYSLLENKMLVSNDYYNDERFLDIYRERLYKSGIRSASTIPVSCFGKTVAFLELFSSEVGFFTDEIIEHIVQLGENVSHALTNIEREEQRKMALTAVQRSQQRLDTTLRSIGDAVMVTDSLGNITMMNPVAESLTGWHEDDVRFKSACEIIKLFNLENGSPVDNPINNVLQTGEIITLDHQSALIARDGRKVPIATSSAPIRSGDGNNIEGAVLVFKDQSEEYETQKALRDSEQRYATLVKTLPVGIIVFDTNSDSVYTNSELTRLIGSKKKALSLQDIQRTVHPQDFPELNRFIRESAQKNEISTTDYYRYLHEDGSIVWAKMRFSPTFDDNGDYTGIVGGVLDVTAERHHLFQVQTLSTMYATLSRINYLVTQASTSTALLESVCETISEVSNFDYVAFYKVDRRQEKFIQTTRSGVDDFNDEVLQEVSQSGLFSAELISSYEQDANSVVINNAPVDEALPVKWRHLAEVSGFASTTLTPVYIDQKMVGIILILSRSKDLFRPNIVELLDEVGDVVSFALAKLESAEQKRKAEQALAINEERLRLGLTATQTGMLEVNYITQKILLDETCIRLLKLSDNRREYKLSAIQRLIPEQSANALETLFDQDKVVDYDDRAILLDVPFTDRREKENGRWLRVTAALTEERTPSNKPVRLLSILSDITEEKKQEARSNLAATVFSNSRESILILNDQRRVLLVNEAFCENYGYKRDEIINKSSDILHSDRYDDKFFEDILSVISETGSWQGEWWRKRKNGEEYPALAIICLVRDVNSESYHAVIQEIDISERKEAERRISTLAYHDELTNLPNRSLLRDRVEQAIVNADREEHTLAILFLDLDHFKNVNDSLGHSFGDRLLQEVAVRLTRSVRKSDTVGRLGGDEFLILLPEACADAAAHVAQKVIDECIMPCVLDDHSLSVTPSIGVAMYPRDGKDYDELLKKADTAMYRAKDEGRNGFRFFTPEMNQAVFERMMLESSLRKALKNQEFMLHYQPKFAIDTMELVGVEALLRWCQPEMGMVAPGQFIPVAEDTGLITEIGHWVLQEACRQAREWQIRFSNPIKVAVNFSARQFAARSVEASVFEVLEATHLPGELLEIEITESLLAQDMDYTYQVLKLLKQQGIYISVDDFGTGYSSLSYLKRFPIDRLKIDQSFVRDLEKDQDDRAIASAVITMGHSLGIRVIAEGIETIEQMQILQQMNCDEGQGYYLGRPMPAEEITKLIAEQSPLQKRLQES